MSTTVRFGIAGAAGRTGRRFIAAIAAASRAELAGVADHAREPCRDLAKRQRTKYFGSHARLIASSDVDAVVACVPPSRRPKLVEDAIAQGKPVLAPLPIASSLSEAEACLDAVRAAAPPCGAVAGYRFLRQAQRAAETVWGEDLGSGAGRQVRRWSRLWRL